MLAVAAFINKFLQTAIRSARDHPDNTFRNEPGKRKRRDGERLLVARVLVHAQLDAKQTVVCCNKSSPNGFGKAKVYQPPLKFVGKAAQGGHRRNQLQCPELFVRQRSGRKRYIDVNLPAIPHSLVEFVCTIDKRS
jgi:hypothetical protein